MGPLKDREVEEPTLGGGGWTEVPPGGFPDKSKLPSGGWDEIPPGGMPSMDKLPTGVIDEIPREVPTLGKLKDTAISQGRNKLTQGLDSAKGNLLEKTGISDMQNKMMKLSEKPASLLGDTKINPNDVIKKF